MAGLTPLQQACATAFALFLVFLFVRTHTIPSPAQYVARPMVAVTHEQTEKQWTGPCRPVAPTAAYDAPLEMFLQTAAVPRPFSLALPPKDKSYVSQHMAASRVWAPSETLIFHHILSRGCVSGGKPALVVDIGANLGYFSILALHYGCRVIAFEPQQRAVEYIKVSAALDPLAAGMTLFGCGVGEEEAFVSLGLDVEWGLVSISSGGGKGEIPVVRLDSIVDEDVLLLKLDTEGYEDRVLRGATKLLDSNRIMNAVVEIKPHNRETVPRVLQQAGFKCHQYTERYGEPLPGHLADSVHGESRKFIALVPCGPGGPEDFWFSREYPVL